MTLRWVVTGIAGLSLLACVYTSWRIWREAKASLERIRR